MPTVTSVAPGSFAAPDPDTGAMYTFAPGQSRDVPEHIADRLIGAGKVTSSFTKKANKPKPPTKREREDALARVAARAREDALAAAEAETQVSTPDEPDTAADANVDGDAEQGDQSDEPSADSSTDTPDEPADEPADDDPTADDDDQE